MRSPDITGMRFGELVAVEIVGRKADGTRVWKFNCDCGGATETIAHSVRIGKVASCKACGAERSRAASIKHGKSKTAEYRIWADIKTRCFNSSFVYYGDYGGRGITMCEAWRDSFEAFLADMGTRPTRGHSIDRIDVDGNYEPTNCRWATPSEQANNKRTNRILMVDGQQMTAAQAARAKGLKYSCVLRRLRKETNGLDPLRPVDVKTKRMAADGLLEQMQ